MSPRDIALLTFLLAGCSDDAKSSAPATASTSRPALSSQPALSSRPAAAPVSPSSPTVAEPRATKIFVGKRQTCVALEDGRVLCSGYNARGMLLLPTESNVTCRDDAKEKDCRLSFEPVAAFSGVRDLVFASDAGCSIGPDASVGCWGRSMYLVHFGKGLDDRLNQRTAQVIPGLTGVVELAMGGMVIGDDETVCARTAAGAVLCWGDYREGGFGDGVLVSGLASLDKTKMGPTQVSGITTAVQVVRGSDFGCARLADGTVQCWGAAERGELGDGTTGDECGKARCRVTPVTVKGLERAVDLSASTSHACAVRDDGAVLCWGMELGGTPAGGKKGVPCGTDKDAICHLSATPMAKIEGAVQVACTWPGACARLKDGTVSCWGRVTMKDMLKHGPSTKVESVPGIRDAVDLRAGNEHVCALTREGKVMCWGDNETGALGDKAPLVARGPVTLEL